MTAAALLGYAALLLAAGPALLARAAWPDRAPVLAVFAWLALAWSALVSVVLGGLALIMPAAQVSHGLARLLTACELMLRMRYAHPGGAALEWAGGTLAAGVTARVAWCAAVTFIVAARAGRRHRRRLRLAGRADTRLGAFVVEHRTPAAYSLPGVRGPIVLSTGAIRALDETQLSAVLAHERAHQTGRHHLLVRLAAVPAAAFPWVPAFGLAREEVARLTELAADDAATAGSPRLAVAEALLALGGAPAGARAARAARAPSWALSAAGSAAAARVRRLIAAPNPLGRAASACGMTVVTALTAVPPVLLVTPAVGVLGMGYCPIP